MKAIVYTKYGSPDVLEYKEVEKPTVKDNEVLIKVCAASLNAADWHIMRADPFFARFVFGLLKPKFSIPGADIAGCVEAVGRNVKEFHVGDEVFGNLFECGMGGFAEYACATENALVLKPANLSFDEAAAVPLAAVTALQIAKSFGAEVTGVSSTGKLEMVRSLGADHVIDYTKEDFTKNGQRYDLIIAANGYHPISDYKRALSPRGIYVMTGGSGAQMVEAMFQGSWISMTGSKKMGNLMMKSNKEDLIFMKELLESGKVVPVIDRRYPLSEVADAMRYLEEGHARGKIVIAF